MLAACLRDSLLTLKIQRRRDRREWCGLGFGRGRAVWRGAWGVVDALRGLADSAAWFAGLADSEQPEKILVVEDGEIKVEKWVSQAEIKAREEEERLQREQAAGDDTAERALNQMMGGSLAGASAVGKLDQVMVKPEHLIPAEGEELLEEHAKELKEWEAQYKAFIADQEAYARTLDSEAKKLKSEMLEECKKFDEGLGDLAAARLENDYKVYELELYKIKLTQAIAQEEDDILAQRSLKQVCRDACVNMHAHLPPRVRACLHGPGARDR